MSALQQAVEDYLALRRSLGFKLREYGICLTEFVSFLKKHGVVYITNKLAVEYATQRQHETPVSWSRRLGIIRGFARYRYGADHHTEIPPTGLLRFRSQRAHPYVYSQDEIRRLLQRAGKNGAHLWPSQRWLYSKRGSMNREMTNQVYCFQVAVAAG